MIDAEQDLSVRTQCELVNISRSGYYYQSKQQAGQDGLLMNEIQDIWLAHPYYGYRRITRQLRKAGYDVNRKRVYRLMQQMQLQAIYPKPRLSLSNQGHKTFPYLLKELKITRPNQVWMTDITYIRVPKGMVYLVALIDVYSRYVVAWELSTSLETGFCLAVLEKALLRHKPDILNSDQGCQFTSEAWIQAVEKAGIQISMDGKGRCLDNVYIERFWRSLKYEDMYVNPPQTVTEARQTIAQYIAFYNQERPHQSLQYQVPAEVYVQTSRRLMDTVDNSIELPTVPTAWNNNNKNQNPYKNINTKQERQNTLSLN